MFCLDFSYQRVHGSLQDLSDRPTEENCSAVTLGGSSLTLTLPFLPLSSCLTFLQLCYEWAENQYGWGTILLLCSDGFTARPTTWVPRHHRTTIRSGGQGVVTCFFRLKQPENCRPGVHMRLKAVNCSLIWTSEIWWKAVTGVWFKFRLRVRFEVERQYSSICNSFSSSQPTVLHMR